MNANTNTAPDDRDRSAGLLAWQLTHYPEGHANPRNLVVHAITAPLFCIGTLAVLAAPFVSAWLALGALLMLAAIAAQGSGHGEERRAPLPFRGPADLAARLFVEQWITFPRFVLRGDFRRALHRAGR